MRFSEALSAYDDGWSCIKLPNVGCFLQLTLFNTTYNLNLQPAAQNEIAKRDETRSAWRAGTDSSQ